jgi:hypothetical protein
MIPAAIVDWVEQHKEYELQYLSMIASNPGFKVVGIGRGFIVGDDCNKRGRLSREHDHHYC